MKPFFLCLFLMLAIAANAQIISQYIETSSGSSPKGIEIWNNTHSDLDFSSNHLVIEKGTNGAIPSPDFTLATGTLASGHALVIGTSDLQSITETNGSGFHLKAFTFNGDDALVVKYGGIITDVVGIPGNDPGTAWSGNGVSTANQNIALKEGIDTGDTDGWSDPSLRFETISTDNSMSGFGIAPVLIVGSLSVLPSSLNPFSYVFQNGPSSSQLFEISGSSLANNVIITPPDHFEISANNSYFSNTPITLTPSSGTLAATTIFVRLKSGLEIGAYPNEQIVVASTGAVSLSIECVGRVKYSNEMELPNAWINEFHYDNDGTDENEWVEVVIENAEWFNLADFTLSLYNGGDGTVYDSQTINMATQGTLYAPFSFFVWKPSSLQNGSPDGLSLSYKGETILFISYEGSFTASDGPASGLISTDIGREESSTKTPATYSLHLVGNGNRYCHFRWTCINATFGEKNGYQFFGDYAPPVPVNIRAIFALFVLVAFTANYQFFSKQSKPKRRRVHER